MTLVNPSKAVLIASSLGSQIDLQIKIETSQVGRSNFILSKPEINELYLRLPQAEYH